MERNFFQLKRKQLNIYDDFKLKNPLVFMVYTQIFRRFKE